jgi:hypothetical protein
MASNIDLDAFVYRPDLHPDEIPTDVVSPKELGVSARPPEFLILDSSLWQYFHPPDRLLMAVMFGHRVFGETEPGGWVALKSGLYIRFGLVDPQVRRRAVRTVESEGLAEVRRSQGKTTLLRLPDYGPQHIPGLKITTRSRR